MKKTEKRPMEIAVAGEFPGFQYGERRSAFLNLGLDVEMDGVTYHLISRFAEKTEMGKVIDTIELERSQRQPA
uniref:hypothetical protein n=1 Tax=Enterocloster clostridioformis TaxID=1531 RepID=UPI0026EB1F6F|nr:hypothetical protein [Enterocloster clostridioformis]